MIPTSNDKRSRHSKGFYTTGAGGKRQNNLIESALAKQHKKPKNVGIYHDDFIKGVAKNMKD